MKQIWHYLVNQFLNRTKDNFKKALKLSNYHDAFLNTMQTDNPGDPDWATLYNRYHPFHLAYVAAYTTWKNAGGQQEGQTLNLDQFLELLVVRAAKWDALVQATDGFEKGTPAYKSIFPNGRYPFNSGAKTARVEAVNVLSQSLDGIVDLAPVKALVDAFYGQLDTARDTQEGAKGTTKTSSQQVELKRVETMTEQYRNLGFLIDKSADNPLFIEAFFDLNVLRESRQSVFTGTLDPEETEAVLIHTFAFDDEIKLEITGEDTIPAGTMVSFYLATTPGGTDSTAVQVEANAAAMTIEASAFGITEYGTHRYLTAVNPNLVETHYEVELF